LASKLAEIILDAAMQCFASSGYHGSTTKAISDKADCTEGSLFRLFGSKDKLFEAALRKAFERGRMPTDELARVLDTDQNFERGLRKGIVECFDRLSEQYVRLATYAILDRPDLAREFLFTPDATRTIAHTIEREIYRKQLRDDILPTTAALQLIAGLSHFAFISPVLSSELKLTTKDARRAAVRNFVEIWLRGMKKPESTPRRSPRSREIKRG
jgi:AcrR family transcriptional regulator